MFRRLRLLASIPLAAFAVGVAVFYLLDRPRAEALEAARFALSNRGIDPDSVEHLAVVDFSLPSFFRRMTVYKKDMAVLRCLVAHGRESGGVFAREFSNDRGSDQTSLGLFRVGEEYTGSHGPSRRLEGLDRGVNHLARSRAIVLHGADYVSYGAVWHNLLRGRGPRLGRSQGCPAVPHAVLPEILEALPAGSYLFHFVEK